MKREWRLDDLLSLVTDPPSSIAPLTCTKEITSRGRYVKQVAAHSGFADVTLRAWPASDFVFRLGHTWPGTVTPDEANALDRSLLEGVVEAALRSHQPPWGCAMQSVAVEYAAGSTTPMAVKIAAAMAMQDMVGRPGWDGTGSSDPEVA